MNLDEAQRIADEVTFIMALVPVLTALDVEVELDPYADSFLPPLIGYDESLRPRIRQRIREAAS